MQPDYKNLAEGVKIFVSPVCEDGNFRAYHLHDAYHPHEPWNIWGKQVPTCP